MAHTAPKDPESGEDILDWACEMGRFARQLLGRESADIVPVISSTGTQYRLRRKTSGSGGGGLLVPYMALPAARPDDADPMSTGWVQVMANGTLLAQYDDPTSNISVTGLSTLATPAPFQLNFEESAEQYIWLAVDLSNLYNDPPTTPTAKVDHGQTWNGDSGDFWPSPAEYDTDDGTPLGTSPPPPANRKQITAYWPLARTYDTAANPLEGIDIPGYLLTDTIRLVQVSHFNLTLYSDCSQGNSVQLVRAHHGCLPG